MPVAEPFLTAALLATIALLLGMSVLFSRAGERFGVPLALVFLAIGMLAGSEGVGGIVFEDYHLGYRIGTAALALILFDGGLNTPMAAVRTAALPAGVLATVGVLATAALMAVAAHLVGLPWPLAFLLGAIVSSTDAAAVFSVLRSTGISLRRRVGTTLEVESGINDPMAVLLTVAITEYMLQPGTTSIMDAGMRIIVEIAVGSAVGIAAGTSGRTLLGRVRLPAGGLYPVLTLSIALLTYGAATMLHGSGFLAVYVTGLLMGNATLPFRSGLLRLHDALAWLSQIVMFLMLGLLVSPTRLADAAAIGLVLALFLAIVARPAVVVACLAPFGYPRREVAYIGWVGLRGAVPIILATFPVLQDAPGARWVFDLVFFVVVVSAIVPGATVRWVTKRLAVEATEPPAPAAILEIESFQPLSGELLSYYVDDELAVCGAALRDVPMPEGAMIALILRGNTLVPPKGRTVFQSGDHVYVLAQPGIRPFVELLFGRPEER